MNTPHSSQPRSPAVKPASGTSESRVANDISVVIPTLGRPILETCPDLQGQAAFLYSLPFWADTPAVPGLVDFDENGIVDGWDLYLFEEALCNDHGQVTEDAVCLYLANLDTLRGEVVYTAGGLAPVEGALTALLTMSSEAQAEWSDRLAPFFGGLAGTYGIVTDAAKAAGEPLSADGDPDGDGLNNKQEADNAVGAGYIDATDGGT